MNDFTRITEASSSAEHHTATFESLPKALQEIGEGMLKKDYKNLKHLLANEYTSMAIEALYKAIPKEYEAAIQHFKDGIEKNPNDEAIYYCLKQLYSNKPDEISHHKAEEYEVMRSRVMIAQHNAFEDIYHRIESSDYNNSPKDIKELKEAVKKYVKKGYNIDERDSTNMTILDRIGTIDLTRSNMTDTDIQELNNMFIKGASTDKASKDKPQPQITAKLTFTERITSKPKKDKFTDKLPKSTTTPIIGH